MRGRPKYKKEEYTGCKNDRTKSVFTDKSCEIKTWGIENEFNTCTDCDKYTSVKRL